MAAFAVTDPLDVCVPEATPSRQMVSFMSGMDREAIIQYYVAQYGSQEVLGAPIDKGFNRLAWVLPYAAGIAGIALVGGIAVRWSRRRSGLYETAPEAPATPELENRLDDELRDLD